MLRKADLIKRLLTHNFTEKQAIVIRKLIAQNAEIGDEDLYHVMLASANMSSNVTYDEKTRTLRYK